MIGTQITISQKPKKGNEIFLSKKNVGKVALINYEFIQERNSLIETQFYYQKSMIKFQVGDKPQTIKLIGDILLQITFYIGIKEIGTTLLNKGESFLRICAYENMLIGLSRYLTYYPTHITSNLNISGLKCSKLINDQTLYTNKYLYYNDLKYDLEGYNLLNHNEGRILLGNGSDIKILDHQLQAIKEIKTDCKSFCINDSFIIYNMGDSLIVYDLKDYSENFRFSSKIIDVCLAVSYLSILSTKELTIFKLPNFELIGKIEIDSDAHRSKIWLSENLSVIFYTNTTGLHYLLRSDGYRKSNLLCNLAVSQLRLNFDGSTLLFAKDTDLYIYRFDQITYRKMAIIDFSGVIENIDLNVLGNLALVQTKDKISYLT